MKCTIRTDDTMALDTVEIRAHPDNPALYDVRDYLMQTKTQKIALFRDDMIFLVDKERCLKFYAEDKKIHVVTDEGAYITRLTLGEIESQNLPFLIRISKSEIININYVKRLDLSFQGTIACEMKDGSTAYVSRRKLSEFRQKLGI